MIPITEDLINMLAPNAAAIANGKKISKQGGFVKLYQSKDETYIGGECMGSGKKPYITSVDFLVPEAPVFRCTCPSRQFPCKHGLAIAFDYLAGKSFKECEVPGEIIEKREKKEKREAAKEEKKETPVKANRNSAATVKKMQKQLEGLDLIETFIGDVLKTGLVSLTGNSIKTYKDLAKQMGDYYLPGPQSIINGILYDVDRQRENSGEESVYYISMMNRIKQLYSIAKKGRAFLQEKIENKENPLEDSVLYENLGYVWKLEQLDELGLYKDNADIVQLSFNVLKDPIKAQYDDLGYWIDLNDGVISKSENLRPFRAVKHLKEEDTILQCVNAKRLYFYPGNANKRIRYDEFTMRDVTVMDRMKIISYAKEDLSILAKEAKNQLKNVLSDQTVVSLLKVKRIEKLKDTYLLKDTLGNRIELRNAPGADTLESISFLPDHSLLEDQVMTIEIAYEAITNKMIAILHSIITEEQIIRLVY